MYMYVASYILYNAKLLWDKTFAVRSPCEYSFTEKTHICIKTMFTSAKALRGKIFVVHKYHETFGAQTFCIIQ